MAGDRQRWAWWAAVTVGALAVVASCSSSASDGGVDRPAPERTTTTSDARTFDSASVATATVDRPATAGNGAVVLGPPGFDLATVGYEETELFLSGTATSYTSDEPLTSDGRWDVRPVDTAPYTTRIVVRRPVDPDEFNGTLYVEWLNVSGGLDAAPDWTYGHVGMVRQGAAWVGVSAQVAGIEGNGGPGAVLALKTADPTRYGALDHPGDDYSYDMFSQAAAAARIQTVEVLGGLRPQRVLAIGESQSAFRLTTYIDALALSTRVFDGFLVHSRGAGAAPLVVGDATQGEVGAPDPTFVRDDLDVPVLVVSSESDLTDSGLGYARARQPDTERFRSWEVAGTAHADAYSLGLGDQDDGSGAADAALFAALVDPPSSVYGGVISCDSPINAGPATYVLRAALAALDAWVESGEPPAEQPRLELDDAGTGFVTDERGIATGGIRTPQVDVPVATLSGLGQTGQSFCGLFGTTVPFDPAAVSAAYPDHAAFVERWDTAVATAVESGVILPADGDALRSAAAASTIGG